ncbi:ribonuclease III domain-containing protein [Pannus brasiliensis CCIBt3594]|uniref:Mini-ribonuclease 3 n=1 Tax=Pannus brasiliensis CCIBt3594 TaxID=1427578 RepID=A0AAW9R0D0_9CHRO
MRVQIDGELDSIGDRVGQLSPVSLAYLGDAVYELYIRARYLWPPKRIADYHDRVVARVRAEQQAEDLARLEPYLTDSERDILRRGRNAATGKPRRLSTHTYRQATGMETLIGYLYLQDPARLQDLLEKLEL